jgi:hypothetical protein
MVRKCASMGPHRCDKRVLLCGVKVCLTIKLIILSGRGDEWSKAVHFPP